MASVREIGIKRAIGKLDVPENVIDVAINAGCQMLPISRDHAEVAASLPLHHKDPFDRMLIAQAQVESLRLASSDHRFPDYGVDLVT